jgi:spore coat protein U-like protein
MTSVGLRAGILLAALVATTPASAATVGTTLNVDATVTANCTVSAAAISFGNVNPISGSDYDAAGGITVTCTQGTGWTATAGVGAGSGASYAARRMTFGASTLNYNIYTDALRTNVWGDGTGTTVTIANSGTGAAQAVTLYGRVPSGQTTVPPGGYADTVAVTVTY